MHILIIGGNGNISSNCVRLLRDRDHYCTVVHRGNQALPHSVNSLVYDRYNADEMKAGIHSLTPQPDVVINFFGFDTPEVQLDIELFKDIVAHYIFISSATVYAKPHTQLPITEQHPKGNLYSEYAQKKQACERLLEEALDHGFPSTIVRPSHTCSPAWLPNPVKSAGYTVAARMLAGQPVFVPENGQIPWTVTAASDFAVGLAGLVGKPDTIGQAFHITQDLAPNWLTIMQTLAEHLKVKNPDIRCIPTDAICERCPDLSPKLKGDKSHPSVFDNSKIKRYVPDFYCHKDISAIISDALAWFNEDKRRKVRDTEVDNIFDRVTA